MLEVAPVCPAGGAYTSRTVYPEISTAYLTCNRTGHVPASTSGW
jgi:hypothetical protein